MVKFNNVNDCLDKWFETKKNDISIISFDAGNLKRTTFDSLKNLTNRYCNYFHSKGMSQGDLILTNLTPSLEYAAVHFALFRLGCIPVIIDTGVSEKQKVACIKESKPVYLISDKQGIILSERYPKEYSSIKLKINISEINFNSPQENLTTTNPSIDLEDTLCLFFTSGSTGTPKATIWSQNNVISQITLQNENLNKLHIHNDLIVFPFFLLTSLLKGMTCVIPEINFGNPVASNPIKIITAIKQLKVSSGFASPAFWNEVVDFSISESITLKSLKMITTAGSTIEPNLIEKMIKVMPNAEISAPYGATEAILPITTINAINLLDKKIVNQTLTGNGVCIGKPVKTATVLVIEPLDDTTQNLWAEIKQLKPYQVGEIIVSGPMVTKGYYKNKTATINSKLTETSTKKLYHRMGDLGYFDDDENLWFCGRKKDSFISKNYTFHTANIEAIFNSILEVKKCAIIRTDNLNLVTLIIEPNSEKLSLIQEKVFKKIDKLLIPIDEVLIYNTPLPVDNRHNTKIERHILKKELDDNNYLRFSKLGRVGKGESHP